MASNKFHRKHTEDVLSFDAIYKVIFLKLVTCEYIKMVCTVKC